MEQTLIDQITCRLDILEEAIREIEKPDGPSPDAGRIRASTPCVERCRIRLLLDNCLDRGAEYQHAMREFNRLSERLALLRNHEEYRDALLSELRHFVGSYHAELCWQAAGPTGHADTRSREIAFLLIEELKDDFDLRDIEQLMGSLDNASAQMNNISDKSPGALDPAGELSAWRYHPGIREE